MSIRSVFRGRHRPNGPGRVIPPLPKKRKKKSRTTACRPSDEQDLSRMDRPTVQGLMASHTHISNLTRMTSSHVANQSAPPMLRFMYPSGCPAFWQFSRLPEAQSPRRFSLIPSSVIALLLIPIVRIITAFEIFAPVSGAWFVEVLVRRRR